MNCPQYFPFSPLGYSYKRTKLCLIGRTKKRKKKIRNENFTVDGWKTIMSNNASLAITDCNHAQHYVRLRPDLVRIIDLLCTTYIARKRLDENFRGKGKWAFSFRWIRYRVYTSGPTISLDPKQNISLICNRSFFSIIPVQVRPSSSTYSSCWTVSHWVSSFCVSHFLQPTLSYLLPDVSIWTTSNVAL